MRCQEFTAILDSYLGDELLVETNHEVLQHLENCANCRRELAARRGLLLQLRTAVKNAPEMQLNPVFASRLRKDLRRAALPDSIWNKLKTGNFAKMPVLAGVAACLLIGIFLGVLKFHQSPPTEYAAKNPARKNDVNLEFSRPTESPVNQALKIALRDAMPVAVGDHENCALHFRLAENPISLDEAAAKYGKFNKNLDKTIISAIGKTAEKKSSDVTAEKLEFLEAHSCVYNNQRFAHIVLRRGKKIISVLVADTENSFGENAATFNENDGNFQIAEFEAARHAVYVVSDLPEQENNKIAERLAPAVRLHIERAQA